MHWLLPVSLYGCWLAHILLAQLPFNGRHTIYRLDYFSLIPNWWLFAPRPVNRDYSIFYRYLLQDGNVTEWTLLQLPVHRSLLGFVWHPQNQVRKIVGDLVKLIIKAGKKDSRVLLFNSPIYLLFVQFITCSCTTQNVKASQFAVMSFRANDPAFAERMIFCSDFHSVKTENAS